MAAGLGFLEGGGALGRLIAGFDWSRTPLGPIAEWSAGLRSAVGIALRSPVPIALFIGPEGVTLYNDACIPIAGRRHPAPLGLDVREAWPELAAFNDKVIRTVLAGGVLSYRNQALTLWRNGADEQVWLNLDYSPIPGEDGRPIGVMAVLAETGERAQRESEAQFRMFAQSMPSHVWAATVDGRLDWFNSRVYEYSGAAPGALDGDGWIALVHPEDRPAAAERWARSLASGEPYEAEFRLRRSDGAFREHIARAVLIRDGDGAPTRWIGTNTDIDDQTRIERALRESELRLRLSQQAAGIASVEVVIASGEVRGDATLWSLWGLPPAESVHTSVLESLVVAEDSAIRSTEATRQAGTATANVEYRIRRADTGELRWIARHIEFEHDADGRPTKMFGVMRDITEAKDAEARQELLTHELEHRIKNILATVSAIASQTLRDTDIESARTALNQRLQALAAAHDILNRSRWTSASLISVVTAAIEPFDTARIRIDGQPFVIGPRRALSLALAVNELGTNSLKHGALSSDAGSVEIRWSKATDATGAPILAWRWSESGGPPVAAPSRRGFGRFLLERVLAADFGGTVRIDFEPTGVECSLTAPWADPRPQ